MHIAGQPNRVPGMSSTRCVPGRCKKERLVSMSRVERCSGEAHAVMFLQSPWDTVRGMLSNVRRPAPEFAKHEVGYHVFLFPSNPS